MQLIFKIHYDKDVIPVPFECENKERALQIFREREAAAKIAREKYLKKLRECSDIRQLDSSIQYASGEFKFCGSYFDSDLENNPCIMTLEEWVEENKENI